MIAAKVTITDSSDRLRRAVARSAEQVHSRAGAYARGVAQRSIRRGRERKRLVPARVPSRPGEPPKTWKRGGLRDSIKFAGNPMKRVVFIGPTRAGVAEIGAVHEYGLRYQGRRYPRRAYMYPAMELTVERMRTWWTDSVR